MVALDSELLAAVWCDLLLDELHAKSAQHRVTGRALSFLALGFPLDRVLDALKVDAAGWEARVAAHAAWRADNRAAGTRVAERLDGGR